MSETYYCKSSNITSRTEPHKHINWTTWALYKKLHQVQIFPPTVRKATTNRNDLLYNNEKEVLSISILHRYFFPVFILSRWWCKTSLKVETCRCKNVNWKRGQAELDCKPIRNQSCAKLACSSRLFSIVVSRTPERRGSTDVRRQTRKDYLELVCYTSDQIKTTRAFKEASTWLSTYIRSLCAEMYKSCL